jgi:hypothetical protein
MGLVHFRANIKLITRDNQGDERETTKSVNYKVDDTVYTDLAAQIGAVETEINNNMAKYVANTNAANTPRSYMGIMEIGIELVLDSAVVGSIIGNLSENGYAIGALPVGQIAGETRDHVEYFNVLKEIGKAVMRWSAPEPEAVESAIDIITTPADFVFPLFSLAAGVDLCNRYGDIVSEALRSDYYAKA